MVVSAVVLGLVLAVSGAAASPAVATHRCGSFIAEDSSYEGTTYYNRITVFNKAVSCKLATEVIKAFWGPEDQITQHGGPSDAQSYWTTQAFPGWRCYQGAGAGSCRSKGRIADYSAKNA